MPWDQIDQGNWQRLREQVKQLIALRKQLAARSMVSIHLKIITALDRVVEYVKNRGRGQIPGLCLNASEKRPMWETEGSVLFARGL